MSSSAYLRDLVVGYENVLKMPPASEETAQIACSLIENGLKPAFDFPSRCNLVQVIAMEESGACGYGIGTLTNVFKTPSEKGYSSFRCLVLL